MKKLSAILLAMALLASMAACGGAKEEAPAQENQTAEKAADEENTEAPAPESESSAAANLDVTLIVGNLGDMSFFDSANEGMERAKADLGAKVNVVEDNYDVSKMESFLLDAAESDSKIVIVSSNYTDLIKQYAPEFPEKVFVLFDDELDYDAGDYSNVYCIMYKANEASFLGGYLAAKLSQSGGEGYNPEKVISFLGGIDQPLVNDFLVGYVEGAQYADPETKVAVSYVGNWEDSAKGKELAISMFNQGADIGFNVAGGAGTGLIEAAAEKGTYVIGVDADQAMVYKDSKPEYADVIPSSVLKNVGQSLYDMLEQYSKDELKTGQTVYLGLSEKSVGLADNEYYQKMVPAEIQSEVKDIEAKIISGEIKVGTAYGMTPEDIIELRNSVNP